MSNRHEPIPKDFEVQPLGPNDEAEETATCGHCGLSWDDGKSTSYTPAPAGRCPFEHFHKYPIKRHRKADGGLKAVLMHLGNKLVTEHGFEPSFGPLRPATEDYEERNTRLITLFTKFVNHHPEAQQALKELGFAWPMSKRPNDARA